MSWYSWGAEKKQRRFQYQRQRIGQGDLQLLKGAPASVLPTVDGAAKEALRCSGQGWYPSDIQVRVQMGVPLLLALVGFRRIELAIDPEKLAAQAFAIYPKVGSPNPLSAVEDAVYSFVRLFAGHYDHCPYDLWRHRRLIEAACRGAYGSGCPSPKEEKVAERIVSFFEQSIVTFKITPDEGAPFVIGLLAEQEINQHPQTLLRTLFQQVQALILPDVWQPSLQENVLDSNLLVAALLPEVMKILFGVRLVLHKNRLRIRGTAIPPQSWDWRECVADLAELLAPYVEDEINSETTPSPFSLPGESPQGPSQGNGVDNQPFPNPFFGRGAGNSSGGSQGNSPSMDQIGGSLPGPLSNNRVPNLRFDELDSLYSQRAQDLVVKEAQEKGSNVEPDQIELGYISSELASLTEALMGQIDWIRTRFEDPTPSNPLGISLFRRCDPLMIPASDDEDSGVGVPHLLLAVDSSGSMSFNPSAPDPKQRGSFDVVLCACYGIFKYIERVGLSDRVQVNALNFSGFTEVSGWRPTSNLEPVKRVLTNYQGGGTHLNAQTLAEAYQSRPGDVLALFVTDGQIGNAAEVLDIVSRMTNEGSSVVLLHVGARIPFTDGVEKAGGKVHLLSNAQDLVGLCLDLAQDKYSQKKGTETLVTR